jgi:hypothetical protein
MVDELTGEEYIEEKPKLAIPEVSFRTMNLRDETVERQFMLELKQAGVPVADRSFMTNIPVEFDDEVTAIQREKLDKVLAELHYQKRLFTAIFVNHLPVPPEYAQAYMEFVSGIQGMAMMMGGTDISDNPPVPNLFPELQPSEGDVQNAMMATGMGEEGGGGQTRSAESDSMRGNMPRQAIRMYANAKEQADFAKLAKTFDGNADLAADMWLENKLAEHVDSAEEDTPEESDASTSAERTASVPSGYEGLVTEEGISEKEAIRIAGIKSIATPSFYGGQRRKMIVPKGAKVEPATEEDLEWERQRTAQVMEEADRWIEEHPEVLDDDDSDGDVGPDGPDPEEDVQ